MTIPSRYITPLLFFFPFSGVLGKEVPAEGVPSSASVETENQHSDAFHSGKDLSAKLSERQSNNSNSYFSEISSHMSLLKLATVVQAAEKAYEQKKEHTSSPAQKSTQEESDTLEPVKPLQPDETVENVIHYLRLISDGSTAHESREVKSFTALLLKDGRFFENEELAPSAFDPTKRPIGSSGTGRWQRDGEAYALAFSDGTEGTAVSSAAITSPAPPSMILIGLFEETTSTPHQILPHRLNFFKDGSLILERPNQIPQSGRYKISQRSIDIQDEQGKVQSFLLGIHEPLDKPQLLVIGTKLYQRIEEEE